MAGAYVYSTVKDFLVNQFSGVYPVIDFDEVASQVEQSEDPFLALEELIAEEETVGIGDPAAIFTRETGSLAIHCFSASPHASDATRQIADAVRSSLRLRNISGVRVSSVSAPDPGELMNAGLWSSAALLMGYEWDNSYATP